MPGVKGDEFLIEVYRRYPQIVTVMLTGQANNDAIENARMNARLHACVHKPWTERELIDVIESGLERNV